MSISKFPGRIIWLWVSLLVVLSSGSTMAQEPIHLGVPLLKQLQQSPEDSPEIFDIYWNLVEQYAWINCDSILHFANEGLQLADQKGNDLDRARMLERLGYAYYWQDLPDSAKHYGSRALEIFEKENDVMGQVLCKTLLGISEAFVGNGEAAQNIYLEALELAESLGRPKLLGDLYYHIMRNFFFLDIPEEAVPYGDRAIAYYQQINDEINLGKAYQFLGNTYRQSFEYEKSREYFERGAELINKYHCPTLKSILYLNYSLFFMDTEDHENLEQSSQLAIQNAEAASFPIIKYLLWGNLGEYYVGRKEYDRAIPVLREAVANSFEPPASYEFPHFLSNAFAGKGMYDSAYFYENRAHKEYLRVIDLGGIGQMQEMQTKYETEKKEAQIALQNQKLAQQRLIQFIIFGVLIFAGIIGFLLYRAYQAKKKTSEFLADLDRQKDRMYANISHEFRTPLTVISGLTDELPESHAESKSIIRRNAQKLLRLVNQMLDLSKLESKAMQIHWQQGDIVPYISYLVQSFQSLADQKQISLTFDSEVEECQMDHDADKLQDILSNLLSNAIKFTPNGGQVQVGLSVFEKTTQKDSKELRISVSDSGPGIPADQLPHIFDRFYQANNRSGHVQSAGGTGIGLALARELVLLLDGTIIADSKIGQGCKFTVTLPIHNLAEQIVEAQDVSQMGIPIALSQTDPVSSKSAESTDLPILLVAEDNPDVQHYIQSILQEKYQLHLANNGQQGIDKALEIVPDIIISDVMMPERDGFDLCNTLKQDMRTSHIPIILLTAKADEASRLSGLEFGADAYLTKPFNKEELFIRLKNMVQLQKRIQKRYASLPARTNENGQPKPAPENRENAFLTKLREVVEARLSDPELTIADLCKAVFLSHTQVYRKLKALTGKTPSKFIQSIRLQAAYEMLRDDQRTVSEVAYDVGFNELSYFSRQFSAEFGKPPSAVHK